PFFLQTRKSPFLPIVYCRIEQQLFCHLKNEKATLDLLLKSLTPVLTDYLGGFYVESLCSFYNFIACSTIRACDNFSFDRVGRDFYFSIAFWTLYYFLLPLFICLRYILFSDI